MIGKLAPCSTEENYAAIEEDNCPEDSRYKLRTGEGGRSVSKPVLNVG